ncbi:MAG: hypothetical protein V3V08_04350 [Nannocystaceae bacterium]
MPQSTVSLPAAPAPRIVIHGYCELDARAIGDRFAEHGSAWLRDLCLLRGDFVVVIEDGEDVYLVSSSFAGTQYHYAQCGDRVQHGRTVLDVLRKSGRPWRWNWAALADLAELEYILEDDSLHPDVHRVAPRSVLHFSGASLHRFAHSWESLHPPGRGSAAATLDAFNEELSYWAAGQHNVLSISGGLDSRVMLSALLRGGHRFRAVVMGPKDSYDVRVSSALSRRFGFDLERVELDLGAYLRQADAIVELTNGTKPAKHWHTYLYSNEASVDHSNRFFVGMAGEYARTFLLDGGLGVRALDRLPLRLVSLVWAHRRRIRGRCFFEGDLPQLNPELAQQLGGAGASTRHLRLAQLAAASPGLLAGLDRYYLEHQVRRFGGNGLALYEANTRWIAPFMTRAWTRAVWQLPRRWKLDSRWHRYALQQNAPDLLRFPDAANARTTHVRTRPFYYIPRSGAKPIPYADYNAWFRSDAILGHVLDHRGVLEEIITRQGIEALVQRQRLRGDRVFAISLILAMGAWLQRVRELPSVR